jgi:hypothetical protein
MNFANELDAELDAQFGSIDIYDKHSTPGSGRKHSDSDAEELLGGKETTPSFVPKESVMNLGEEMKEFEKQYTPASAQKVTPIKAAFENDGAAHVLEALSVRRKLWADENDPMVGIEGNNKNIAANHAFSTTAMVPDHDQVIVDNIQTLHPPTSEGIVIDAPKLEIDSSFERLDEEVKSAVVPLVSEYSESGGIAWEEAVKSAARIQEKAVREIASNAKANPSEEPNQDSKAVAKIDDERIHGDFSHWHTGPRLSCEGIRLSYIGAYETVQNSGGYYSVRVLECVVRPDIALADLIGAVVRVAKTVMGFRYIIPCNNSRRYVEYS